MKTIPTLFWKTGLAALTGLVAMTSSAQKVLPEDALPMIVAPHEQSIDSRDRTLCIDVTANVPFEVNEDADWVKVIKNENGKVYLYIYTNYYNESRSTTVTFTNAEKKLSHELKLTQGADESVNYIPTDTQIKPVSASDNNHQGGHDISKTYDGDIYSIYHSDFYKNYISKENPAVLTYEFKDVEQIDYINYCPRINGGSNGNFGEVEVYVKTAGDEDFKLYNKYDWKKSSSIRTINFENGLKNPTAIQFKVYSGHSDKGEEQQFASCAEMQFCVKTSAEDDYSIFTNDLYYELKKGITEADIEKLDDPFAKSLGYQLLKGDYETKYRVAEYPCFLSYYTLSNMLKAPGKLYDQIEGVTGINIPAHSKTAVIVRGIPDNVPVQLKVVAWYTGRIGGNFDGGNPNTTTYTLRNGVNVIDYQYDYDGLAYISYYADENPEKYENIKVHFVNGEINGYLSPEKSNEEMHAICKNAKNRCMDLYGKKVHQIWEAKGLHSYCRAVDGKLGYRQFMNTIDSLIAWEHRSLGLEKYNRVPKNHTMAYVNYTYYMFQGSFGVSFHMDQQSRVLNCKNIIEKDNDAIWGLSHEWGHQHQMHPHFCWSGMSEVTNNMQSYYNIMKMGFRESDKINGWPTARKHFLQDEGYSTGTKTSNSRRLAYNARHKYSHSKDLFNLFEAMKDSVIKPIAEDKTKGVSYAEVGVNEILCPLIMLHNYFTENGKPDFMPDWYEALRQSDSPEGSKIEKQSGIDKYEILARCQNGNLNNGLKELREKYPNSCWVTEEYITENKCDQNDNAVPFIMNFVRKVSRLSGYNLFPYFEQWGYLRQVAVEIGDYGTKYYAMTQKMYDEFKADMDELVKNGEIQEMPEGLVEKISNSPDWFQLRPIIAN